MKATLYSENLLAIQSTRDSKKQIFIGFLTDYGSVGINLKIFKSYGRGKDFAYYIQKINLANQEHIKRQNEREQK